MEPSMASFTEGPCATRCDTTRPDTRVHEHGTGEGHGAAVVETERNPPTGTSDVCVVCRGTGVGGVLTGRRPGAAADHGGNFRSASARGRQHAVRRQAPVREH